MEHDHQSSKAEEKAAGPQVRKKTASPVPSSARAVFDLQRAAGNRAVAKMLKSPSGRPTVQRTPPAPVNVQRDLTPSFESQLELAVKDVGSEFDMKPFAESLVKLAGKSKGGAGGTSSIGSGGKSKSGERLSADDIAKRQKALDDKRTPEARQKAKLLKDKQDTLEAGEDRFKNEDKLRDAEQSLAKSGPKEQPPRVPPKPLTDEEVKALKDDELADKVEDLEEEVKEAENRRKWNRGRRTKPMSSGDVKSLRGLI